MADEKINLVIGTTLDTSQVKKTADQAEKILAKGAEIPVKLDTKEAVKQIDKLKKKQKELETKIALDIDTDKSKKQLKEIESQLKKTQAAFNKKIKIDVDASKAKKDIKKVESDLKDLKSPEIKPEVDSSGVESALGDLTGKLQDFAKLGTAGIAVAVGAAFAALIQRGGELESVFAKISARTGRVGDDLDVVREKSNQLFLAGVGETVEEAAQAFGIADQQLGKFLDNDEEIAAFTQSAAGIAGTFDKDINEVIEKSRTLIGSFGLDGKEAGDLIALTLRDAGNQADDVLDTFAEYSIKMSEAGFSAEKFSGTLIRGVQGGIFNTDKLADAIQETQLRLEAFDTSKGLGDLVGALGGAGDVLAKELQEIAKAAEQGEISAADLLGLSAEKIQASLDAEQIDKTIANRLISEIGGVPSEAIGAELYGEIFGAPINEEQIRKKAEEAGNLIAGAIDPKGFDEISRILSVSFDDLATTVYKSLEPALKLVGGALLFVIENLKVTFNVIGILLKPVGLIIDAFIELGTYLYNTIKPVLDAVGEAFDAISETVGGVLNKAINVAVNVFNKVKDAIFGADEETDKFGNTISKTDKFIQEFSTAIKTVTGFVIGFIDKISSAIDFVADLFGVSTEETKKAEKATVDYTGTLSDFNFILDGNTKKLKDNDDVIKRIPSNLKKAKSAYDEFKKSFVGLDENIQTSSLDIGNVFERFSGTAGTDVLLPINIKPVIDEKEIEYTTKSLADSYIKSLGGFQDRLTDIFKDNSNERKKAIKDELEETSSELESALNNEQISFEEYQSRLLDAEEKATEDRKQIQKDGFESMSDTQKAFAASFELFSVTLKDQFNEAVNGDDGLTETFAAFMDSSNDELGNFAITAQDVFGKLADVGMSALVSIGAEVGEAMAKGEDGLKTLANATLEATSAILLSLAPTIVKAAFDVNFFLGLASIATIPLVFAALEALKPPKIGAEEGVVGITKSYNKKAGTTDNIPLWVAEGEAISSKMAVDTKGKLVDNREFLEYGNKGLPMENLILEKMPVMPVLQTVNYGGSSKNNTEEMEMTLNKLEKTNKELNKLLKSGIYVESNMNMQITKSRDIKVKQIPLYRF